MILAQNLTQHNAIPKNQLLTIDIFTPGTVIGFRFSLTAKGRHSSSYLSRGELANKAPKVWEFR